MVFLGFEMFFVSEVPLQRAVLHQRRKSIRPFEGKMHAEQRWHEHTGFCALFILHRPSTSDCSPSPSLTPP